jgi:hypothetical protein
MTVQSAPVAGHPAFGTREHRGPRLPQLRRELSFGQRLGVLAIGAVTLAAAGIARQPAADSASTPAPLPAAAIQPADERYIPCLTAVEPAPLLCQFGYGAALRAAVTDPR